MASKKKNPPKKARVNQNYFPMQFAFFYCYLVWNRQTSGIRRKNSSKENLFKELLYPETYSKAYQTS